MAEGEPPLDSLKKEIKPKLVIEFNSIEELVTFTAQFKDTQWWKRIKRT